MTEKSEYRLLKKAYENPDFLNSETGRGIRILCEYEEPQVRLKNHNIQATVLFFGSARAKSPEEFLAIKTRLETEITTTKDRGEADPAVLAKAEEQLQRLMNVEWMIEYYNKTIELSRKLTQWGVKSDDSLASGRTLTGTSRYFHHARGGGSTATATHTAAAVTGKKQDPQQPHSQKSQQHQSQQLVVITGGGPGFMEAANFGASLVPEAINIGMGISLPFETGLNKFVTPNLGFLFHYFFTRKFWMVYHAQALVCCPGGMGTCDELFELLTLKQTGKLPTDLPVVLLGKEYWTTIVNWQALVKYGVVSQHDVDDLFITDDVDAAYSFIVERLMKNPLFHTVDTSTFVSSSQNHSREGLSHH